MKRKTKEAEKQWLRETRRTFRQRSVWYWWLPIIRRLLRIIGRQNTEIKNLKDIINGEIEHRQCVEYSVTELEFQMDDLRANIKKMKGEEK